MDEAKLGPLFLDTSIQIARLVHGPQTKDRIKARIAQHQQTETSLVARQEFKRRLLTEAEYLLRLLKRYGSYDEVQQHLIRLPGSWPGHVRKRNICLQTLAQVHEASAEERTDRLRLYLHSLLVAGLKRHDQSVDHLRRDSGCGCASIDVIQQPSGKYQLGPKHCSRLNPGVCGIVSFLESRADIRNKILQKLKSLPADKKTKELQAVEAFLELPGKKMEKVADEDPCLKVGDLLIALESAGTPFFYTLNSAESQHLCRALDQTLIVRPVDPLKDDVECDLSAPQWPEFGKMASPSKTHLSEEGQAEEG